MFKKYLGGLGLLVFVFTFLSPPFVEVNTTNADPTRTHRQPYQYDYYCSNGSFAYSESGTQETTYDFDHPPDSEQEVPILGLKWDPIVNMWVTGIIGYKTETTHTSHSVTSIWNSTVIREDRTAWDYWSCR